MGKPQQKMTNNSVFLRTISLIAVSLIGAIGGGYLVHNLNNFNLGVNQDVNKNNEQNTETNTQTGNNNQRLGNITAGDNAKIDITIKPGDANFQNEQLPGYFPSKGFETSPPELSKFEGAGRFTKDLLIRGEALFSQYKVVILGKRYLPIFSLDGSSNEVRRTTFELNGKQQAILLQFGLPDLTAGTTNLIYKVNILADGEQLWSGDVIYGTSQQILSVPLKAAGVTTLVIEYSITQGNSYMKLFFTRAELIYSKS